jgi:hypothetical protein
MKHIIGPGGDVIASTRGRPRQLQRRTLRYIHPHRKEEAHQLIYSKSAAEDQSREEFLP